MASKAVIRAAEEKFLKTGRACALTGMVSQPNELVKIGGLNYNRASLVSYFTRRSSNTPAKNKLIEELAEKFSKRYQCLKADSSSEELEELKVLEELKGYFIKNKPVK